MSKRLSKSSEKCFRRYHAKLRGLSEETWGRKTPSEFISSTCKNGKTQCRTVHITINSEVFRIGNIWKACSVDRNPVMHTQLVPAPLGCSLLLGHQPSLSQVLVHLSMTTDPGYFPTSETKPWPETGSWHSLVLDLYFHYLLSWDMGAVPLQ